MSDTDEESYEEFDHNSSIEHSSSSDDKSSDEKEDLMCYLGVDDLSNGTYVLYQWEGKGYYVGSVTGITSPEKESEITLNLMKKYNVWGNNPYFIWPPRSHIVVIDDRPVSKFLSHSMIDRSGTTVIYDVKLFNEIPLSISFIHVILYFLHFFTIFPGLPLNMQQCYQKYLNDPALIIPQKFDFCYRLVSDAGPNSHRETLRSEKQTLISQIGNTMFRNYYKMTCKTFKHNYSSKFLFLEDIIIGTF